MKSTLLMFALLFSTGSFANTCVSVQVISKPKAFLNIKLQSSEETIFSYDGVTLVDMMGTASKSIRVNQLRTSTCSLVSRLNLLDEVDSKRIASVSVNKSLNESSTNNCLGGLLPTISVDDYSSKSMVPDNQVEAVTSALKSHTKQGSLKIKVGECADLIKDFANLPNQL